MRRYVYCQQGWRIRDVHCSAGLEEKRCSLFSRVEGEEMFNVQQGWRRRNAQCTFNRVGGEEMFTVQQGWRGRNFHCSAGLSLRKKIKDGKRLERLNGTDFILPPLFGILNLTNLK